MTDEKLAIAVVKAMGYRVRRISEIHSSYSGDDYPGVLTNGQFIEIQYWLESRDIAMKLLKENLMDVRPWGKGWKASFGDYFAESESWEDSIYKAFCNWMGKSYD